MCESISAALAERLLNRQTHCMKIPDFQSLMLPVLNRLGQQRMATPALTGAIADECGLDDEQRAQLLPSGRQRVFDNRIHWALAYLMRAGLLTRVARGVYEASERGREMLRQSPERLNIAVLRQFPEFGAFRSDGRPPPVVEEPYQLADKRSATPDERIGAAVAEKEAEIRGALLRLMLERPPVFFERLVVRLLQAMGYGDGSSDSGLAVGRGGDGGIDGIIREDKLGLDLIYVQAKRYSEGAVPPAQIQAFAGALNMRRANKGVFITTSRFTPAARQVTEQVAGMRIILIDGDELTRLMLAHDVGVRREEEIVLKKIDMDFFEPEEPV